MNREFPLPDEAASIALGERMAASLPADTGGWLVTLEGDLGAGKTTLVRAILGGLGHSGPVPSPTYTLVEPYDVGGHMIYHVDLYRLSGEEELEFLGWSELRDGLVMVEWPDRAPQLTGSADVTIRLMYAGTGRLARVTAQSGAGRAWLRRLAGPADIPESILK